MKNKFLQYTLLCCSLMVFFSACRKDPFNGKETKESGKTFVYIEQAQTNNQFFDVFTDIKSVKMFTVRRDAASKADLQKAVTVKLTAMDQTYIDASNTKNGTTYTLLPSSIYTLGAEPGVAIGTNSDLTLSFAGGDFAKNVIFNIDGSKVDLSKQYAVAYVITNFGGFSKEHTASGVSQDTILATVAIKNKWDGTYAFTGTMTDAANGTLTHINDYLTALASSKTPAPMQYELRTISATQNVVYDNYLGGGIAVDINSGGSASHYGSVGIVVTFDPATNKVVSMVNYYGQPAPNTRSLELDPDGVNAYDSATKTIKIKYRMLQPSVITDPPYIRVDWDETWTYLHAR